MTVEKFIRTTFMVTAVLVTGLVLNVISLYNYPDALAVWQPIVPHSSADEYYLPPAQNIVPDTSPNYPEITMPDTEPLLTEPVLLEPPALDYIPQEPHEIHFVNFMVYSITGAHDSRDGEVIGRITPGTLLQIRYQYCTRWFAAYHNEELIWIDKQFTPPTHQLTEFLNELDVSVYFENMATGFIFRHNAERRFFGASATKAPFVLYIYAKAAAGYTCLYDVHAFTPADYWGGSGFIRRRYEYGATFNQHQLLHLMLSPSDNIATRILRRVHGLAGYRNFIASLGGNPAYIQNLTYSHLSANEAGFYMRAKYQFIANGCRYGELLKQNLLANRYPFITSRYPVASKSGWAANFGGAFHDMAIVYAPSPYVLAVLSDWAGSQADHRTVREISRIFQEFNDKWFTYTPTPYEIFA